MKTWDGTIGRKEVITDWNGRRHEEIDSCWVDVRGGLCSFFPWLDFNFDLPEKGEISSSSETRYSSYFRLSNLALYQFIAYFQGLVSLQTCASSLARYEMHGRRLIHLDYTGSISKASCRFLTLLPTKWLLKCKHDLNLGEFIDVVRILYCDT
jgi:hypothetical protein